MAPAPSVKSLPSSNPPPPYPPPSVPSPPKYNLRSLSRLPNYSALGIEGDWVLLWKKGKKAMHKEENHSSLWHNNKLLQKFDLVDINP
jgi:hypothetical protein